MAEWINTSAGRIGGVKLLRAAPMTTESLIRTTAMSAGVICAGVPLPAVNRKVVLGDSGSRTEIWPGPSSAMPCQAKMREAFTSWSTASSRGDKRGKLAEAVRLSSEYFLLLIHGRTYDCEVARILSTRQRANTRSRCTAMAIIGKRTVRQIISLPHSMTLIWAVATTFSGLVSSVQARPLLDMNRCNDECA